MKTQKIGNRQVAEGSGTMDVDDQVARLEAISNDLKLDLDGLNTLITWISTKGLSDDLSPVFVRELIHAVKASLIGHVTALNETADWAEVNA